MNEMERHIEERNQAWANSKDERDKVQPIGRMSLAKLSAAKPYPKGDIWINEDQDGNAYLSEEDKYSSGDPFIGKEWALKVVAISAIGAVGMFSCLAYNELAGQEQECPQISQNFSDNP